MKIFLGTDHRGYFLKEKIARWLLEWGYKFSDLGAESLDLNDDYTFYAEKVASMINPTSVKAMEDLRGILLCGSGVGVDITANKFDGVRAGIGLSAEQVKAAREDDNINILVIAADYTPKAEAREMLKVFLETKFDQKTRHKKRLSEIARIEANN